MGCTFSPSGRVHAGARMVVRMETEAGNLEVLASPMDEEGGGNRDHPIESHVGGDGDEGGGGEDGDVGEEGDAADDLVGLHPGMRK